MYHGGLPEEREGYSIKEVSQSILSNSVFAPDACIRPTQTNIGYFLDKNTTAAEESYGTHKTEYGGTGEIKFPFGTYEQFTIRSIHHNKTGLDEHPQSPICSRSMINRIKENKSFFAQPIKDIGPDGFEISHSLASKSLPVSVQKQLFPRSIVYELEYIKDVYRQKMMLALDRERKLFEEKIRQKKAEAIKKKHRDYNDEAEITEATIIEEPNNHGQMLKTNEINTEVGRADMKIDKYEIIDKDACTSTCGRCGCVLTRGQCPKCIKTEPKIYGIDEMSELEPRYVYPWGSLRQRELIRVCFPFATNATKLYAPPAFDAKTLYRPNKKRFPEKCFSQINI